MIKLEPPLVTASDLPLRVTPHGEFGQPRPLRKGIHAGLDFMAHDGEPVLAAAAGVVDRHGYDKPVSEGGGGGGNYVVLRHDVDGVHYETAYMHLEQVDVKDGEQVPAGETIGLAGHSGVANSGAHLHFELRQYVGTQRIKIDPTKYFIVPPVAPKKPPSTGGGLAVVLAIGGAAWKWLT